MHQARRLHDREHVEATARAAQSEAAPFLEHVEAHTPRTRPPIACAALRAATVTFRVTSPLRQVALLFGAVIKVGKEHKLKNLAAQTKGYHVLLAACGAQGWHSSLLPALSEQCTLHGTLEASKTDMKGSTAIAVVAHIECSGASKARPLPAVTHPYLSFPPRRVRYQPLLTLTSPLLQGASVTTPLRAVTNCYLSSRIQGVG